MNAYDAALFWHGRPRKIYYSMLKTVCVLLCLALAASAFAGTAVAETCSGSLQDKIDAAPVGGVVTASPCVYREQVTIRKPLTLVGQPGSEIRGSDVWDAWKRRRSDDRWVSINKVPAFPQETVSCELGSLRCSWPEQVFLDSEPLKQAGSRPEAGEFSLTAKRKVVLPADPGDRLVEVTVRRHWITGGVNADRVAVEGFTMKHAANEWRSGAIINREPTTRETDGTYHWSRLKGGGSNWTIENNVLTDAHGAILSVKGAEDHQILNNEIARGGQLGIHNAGTGTVVKDNEIYDNNTESFCFVSRDCTLVTRKGRIRRGTGIKEAGGIKIAGGTGNVLVDHNEVSYNRGNGIWFDVDTHDVMISDNTVDHNDRRGIHFEISRGGTIVGNTVYENGWLTPNHVEGSGIGISNSSEVEVYDNTLAWNADGIAVVGFEREGHELVHDVSVHGNTILSTGTQVEGDSKSLALGWIQGWTDTMFDPSNANMGANNSYWFPSPEDSDTRYEWRHSEDNRLARFNDTPGEEHGRYLTQAEKDALVAAKSVPANSERH